MARARAKRSRSTTVFTAAEAAAVADAATRAARSTVHRAMREEGVARAVRFKALEDAESDLAQYRQAVIDALRDLKRKF